MRGGGGGMLELMAPPRCGSLLGEGTGTDDDEEEAEEAVGGGGGCVDG